ncbi:MAG: outer membrane beta-barrel protein [Prolixibacteraceae bacterium]
MRFICKKWWNMSSFFIYNYSTFKGDLNGTIIDLKTGIFNLRLQNNLQLPADITMELTYELNNPWICMGSVKVDVYSGIDIGLKIFFGPEVTDSADDE